MNKSFWWVLTFLIALLAVDFSYQSHISQFAFWKSDWFYFRLFIIAVFSFCVLLYYWVVTVRKTEIDFQDYVKYIYDMQEDSWKNIASELHDSLGQNLLVLNNEIKQISNTLPEPQSSEMNNISKKLVESIDDIRRMSSNIHPHLLERYGLTKAIESMISNAFTALNINLNLQISNVDKLIPRNVELNLYRIIQESINNIIKHSEAKNVDVMISAGVLSINVSIQDDGKGFEITKESGEKAIGFGIYNMYKRVKMDNGIFDIQSAPGNGTKIKISFPVKKI